MFLADHKVKIVAACNKYPLPDGVKYSYGTSGFRTIGTNLIPVAFRMTLAALLRAFHTKQSVGVMMTASHNPAKDNGLKMIDPHGDMLAGEWEPIVANIANKADGESYYASLEALVKQFHIAYPSAEELAKNKIYLHVGRDTRATGPAMLEAVKDCLKLLDLGDKAMLDHGVCSTPILHTVVNLGNLYPTKVPTKIDYFDMMLKAMRTLLEFTEPKSGGPRRKQPLIVDCANGVGAVALRDLLEYSLKSHQGIIQEYFEVTMVNTNTEDRTVLNKDCGADFCQHYRKPSAAHDAFLNSEACDRIVASKLEPHFYALDGDADRVVAFFAQKQARGNVWELLDGDRMSILLCTLALQWIGAENIAQANQLEKPGTLDLGVVQTAYGNGASTTYIQNVLHFPNYLTATGVKYLHPVAHARDIGIYFEPNGHGTMLMRDTATLKAHLGAQKPVVDWAILEALRGMFSQCCGDAIADMFGLEVALRATEKSFMDWCGFYKDLPCFNGVIRCKDPKAITNTPDERQALSPPGMQAEITAAIEKMAREAGTGMELFRAFVRPSGTEPIVRLYAEGSTDATCVKLAEEVTKVVQKYCPE